MIQVNGIMNGIVSLAWDTEYHSFAGLTIIYEGDSLPVKPGDPVEAMWGEPGGLLTLRGYTAWRVRKEYRSQLVAHEFAGSWHQKTQRLLPGPRSSAIRILLDQNGEHPGENVVKGGDIEYSQNESDIAMLYRLAGVNPIWRNDQGDVCICPPPGAEIGRGEVIDLKPTNIEPKKYVVSGFSPEGRGFEVKLGEGPEIRVSNVFHSPGEAREYLELLANSEPKAVLRMIGRPEVRAGSKLKLYNGTEWKVTRCRHEVVHNAWTITAYLR